MARIRTIKPEFFTSADICGLSLPARLMYIATWLEADREGRLKWQPDTWRFRYFPADAIKGQAVAQELVDAGLVVRYGNDYAYIPSFHEHQYVNGREAASRLPDPNDPARVDDDPSDLPTRGGDLQDHRDGYSFPFPLNDLDRDQAGASKPTARQTRVDALTALFEAQFWPHYPRKVAKAAALKAWLSLGPAPELVTVMVAALGRQSQQEAWQRDGGIYIPHAATWIRGRRWEDSENLHAAPVPAVDAERERTVAIIRERDALWKRATLPGEGRTP